MTKQPTYIIMKEKKVFMGSKSTVKKKKKSHLKTNFAHLA